jgi:hypothetical protein
VAHRAVWRLAVVEGMEAFLDQHLVAPRLPKGWLKQQLRDLDSDDFATREKAQRELAKVGLAARPALEEALRTAVDLELRRRLERLLRPLHPSGALALQEHRAVLALEARASSEARRLLRKLAGGEPAAPLTQEAKAALARLEPR